MGTLVSEFASDLLEQAQRARNLLRAYQKGDRRGLQRLIGTLNISHQISAYIVADRAGGRAQLQLKAPDLLSLIWIQVAVSISGGATIRECKLCGAWFEAGPKRDRRADSDFCSDEHKTQYHNANRAKRK
jgi:hypothetical protein